MYDATPIQCIAHGLVPIAVIDGPIVGVVGEGFALIERTGLGTIAITLDGGSLALGTPGLPGGGTVTFEDSRPIICPFINGAGPVAFDILGPAPAPIANASSIYIVSLWSVLTGLRVDGAFTFIIMRAAASVTSNKT